MTFPRPTHSISHSGHTAGRHSDQRSRAARLVPLGLATGALVVGGLSLGGPTAQAAPSAPAFATGRVVATGGVTARSLPTTASTGYGAYPHGDRLTLLCKVRGSTVAGNATWYLVPAEGWEFVSARYVANVGPAPAFCGRAGDAAGRTTGAVRTRVAPTTRAAAAATLPRGTRVSLRCEVEGPAVQGNRTWYYLDNHRWVSARYVANVGHAPRSCSPG
ncbi:hypothetical protein FHX74_003659 [Friedmanniella endophytica]|uniref:SH3 domain-containing protein n=1 Tax=Microlunatus kandeliicorticis TaxID=1759536 RepID=A0A7W3P7G9_9ACTN|nr:hypothetical protein [Microlunatus kandeliicorticis]MBA8796018.1 hypothetical protein [Microlunatus kandeliicorticis]